MTAPTRRGLLICLVLGLITLPVELLLVPVARVPGAAQAADAWAADQQPDYLRAASQQIDAYPSVYRRAIMAALTPADRSDAWRAHFRQEGWHPTQWGGYCDSVNGAIIEVFVTDSRQQALAACERDIPGV